MYWLDFIGACLSLSSTYYFTQAKRLAWVIGLLAVILNTVLYWQKGIYGQWLLEITYFFSMIYGWFQWSRAQKTERAIRMLSLKEGIVYMLLSLLLIAGFSTYLIHFTDSDIPYLDASTTILSLVAQWLLCQKVLQCWIVWLIVDAMIACLQFYKGLPFHSTLYWIYLGMAVWGYYRWKQIGSFNAINGSLHSSRALS